MSVSEKDFEAIAAEVAGQLPLNRKCCAQCAAGWWTLSSLSRGLSAYFAGENPNFDPDRFRAACGFGP